MLAFSKLEEFEKTELVSMLMESFNYEFTLEDTQTDVDLAFSKDIYTYHFYVGKEADRIVCAGALKKTGIETDVWGISWIAVVPQKQKLGYGRQTVEFLINQFALKFIKSNQGVLTLCAKQGNFAFYEKLKFSSVEANNDGRIYYKLIDKAAPAGK